MVHKPTEKVQQKPKPKAQSAKAADDSSFCGFKKGFLSSSSPGNKPTTNQSSSKTKDDAKALPFIKPKEKPEDSLKFDEVQSSMNAGQAFLQNKGLRFALNFAVYKFMYRTRSCYL